MYLKIGTVLGCTIIAAAFVSAAQTGDKEINEKGQVKVASHLVETGSGQMLYQFKVDGNGFRPRVKIIRSGYFPSTR